MGLYEQSLALEEQLGDQNGKSTTLHQMAGVLVRRGELEKAMGLYEQSLAVEEQLGDQKGKSATLHAMANVHMARDEWEKAERCLSDALAISRRLGDRQEIAFNTVKMGQVAQAHGDPQKALAAYQEGLQIFQQLGMPRESEQVSRLITALQEAPAAQPDPLSQLIADARAASARDDHPVAVASQEQALALWRERLAAHDEGGAREELVTLSVLLYNLAGYYGDAGRHADAVRALEEVVALDERTNHADLASDRQVLEAARRMAALSPEERAQLQRVASPAGDPSQDE
jgi:tetratricopeptide (TPR) repeat protein